MGRGKRNSKASASATSAPTSAQGSEHAHTVAAELVHHTLSHPAHHAVHKPPRYQPTTFIGRLFDDFHSLPWDKVVAALISGMLLYIGAARLHFFSDELADLKVEMSRQRNELFEMHKRDIYRIELEMSALEMRTLKAVKMEVSNIIPRLESMLSELHSLDKRQNTLDVLHRIRSQTYAVSGSGVLPPLYGSTPQHGTATSSSTPMRGTAAQTPTVSTTSSQPEETAESASQRLKDSLLARMKDAFSEDELLSLLRQRADTPGHNQPVQTSPPATPSGRIATGEASDGTAGDADAAANDSSNSTE